MPGVLVWDGKSQIDGNDIVLIATENSKNEKTGPMLQCWILNKNVNPMTALKTGQDKSICGDCKFRGGICYVNVAQAPNQIFKTYKLNKYPKVDDSFSFFNNKKVRFGAYGEPVAIPINVWHEILAVAKSHTAYTHQWKKPEFAWYKEFCMASVDSEFEYQEAKKLGWRTFRVKSPTDFKLLSEVVCPASEEANYKTTCAKCLLCGGTSKVAKDIVINSHGLPHKIKKFENLNLNARSANPSKIALGVI